MIPFLDTALKAIHKQYYDDVVDRLNYYYSTLILLFLAILVSAKQYVGSPIQCWVPAQFRGGWEQYAENYCFVQNTYYLPYDKTIPTEIYERDYRKIGYYQWVPIVLAIQGMLFYMPNLIWNMLSWQSGINVKSILKMAAAADVIDEEKRKPVVKNLAKYIEDSLGLREGLRSVGADHVLKSIWGQNINAYLCSLYVFIKFLNIVNVVGQFFLLNDFLGTNYTFWGVQILSDLFHGREWKDSGHFPRVTLCDFNVRELGNIHRHTIQCVLMINMFNEKIYIFLWLWMFFVAVVTSLNFLYWLLICIPKKCRDQLVHRYLRINADIYPAAGDRRVAERFSLKVLKPDGVLLLRFVGAHAGDMIATELTLQMLTNFMNKIKEEREQATKDKHSTGAARQPPYNNGFNELLYDTEKESHPMLDDVDGQFLQDSKTLEHNRACRKPNGYPGPPCELPKSKLMSV